MEQRVAAELQVALGLEQLAAAGRWCREEGAESERFEDDVVDGECDGEAFSCGCETECAEDALDARVVGVRCTSHVKTRAATFYQETGGEKSDLDARCDAQYYCARSPGVTRAGDDSGGPSAQAD